MSWQKVIEEGQVFWVNEELGNVMKTGEYYVAMMPMICKLGPFNTLEEAQQALENKEGVKNAIDQYNATLLR